MNRPILLLVLATSVGRAVLQAQSAEPVAQPATAAPAVVTTTPSSPAVVQVPATPNSANVTQIVYTPQLPSAADITNAANAQGLTVERIVQTSNQVIAFYRNANGQTSNVAYQSLPPAGTSVPASPTPNVVVTSPPPPTVVYQTPPPSVIYYDYPTPYYSRVYYPPVSFSVGLGYHRGYYGGRHYHHHRR